MKRRTRTVALYVGLGVAVAVVVIVVAAFSFFSSHRSSVAITAQLADNEFSRLRARFVNEQPLLDMGRRQAPEMPAVSAG